MWSAVIRRKGADKPLEVRSLNEIKPVFHVDSGWIIFAGSFDTIGLPWSEVEDFHIYQEGTLVA